MTVAHELLTRNDGAIAGDAHVADAVHLLGKRFLAEQGTVTLHDDQAGLHGIEVHLYPAFRFSADATVGDYQRFPVRHPGDLMRTDAMRRDLGRVHQSLVDEAVDTQ